MKSYRSSPLRKVWLVMAGVPILAVTGFAAWLLSLAPSTPASTVPSVSAQDHAAMIAQLKPKRRGRPLVAIVGINDATETTDYVMTHGILRRSGVVDVMALATHSGPVKLYPALSVLPDASLSEFDADHPGGADYVIVPAMSRDDDPMVTAWLREQASKGATIIAVCAGAKVLAEAGLLRNRSGTTHWFYLADLRSIEPTMKYVPNRRFVVDGSVATTTGISASMPMMLTLIEAIAGRSKAETLGQKLGAVAWDASHDSSAFRLTRRFALTVLRNRSRFWNHDRLNLPLSPEVDQISLALTADAWSRTYRSQIISSARTRAPVRSSDGLLLLPESSGPVKHADRKIEQMSSLAPQASLDASLAEIARRYGRRTAEIVSMQLEYQR